jgi:hypothetical protein
MGAVIVTVYVSPKRTNRGIEISGRLPGGWLALRRWLLDDQHPGDFGLGCRVRAAFRAPGNDVFLCKTACWFSRLTTQRAGDGRSGAVNGKSAF